MWLTLTTVPRPAPILWAVSCVAATLDSSFPSTEEHVRTSTSATLTMEAVTGSAPTWPAHSAVAVSKDSSCRMTAPLALVSLQAQPAMHVLHNIMFCLCMNTLYHIPLPPPHMYIAINQCEDGTNNCAQNCVNNGGSFTCSCRSGFLLASDGRGCNGEKEVLTGTHIGLHFF